MKEWIYDFQRKIHTHSDNGKNDYSIQITMMHDASKQESKTEIIVTQTT